MLDDRKAAILRAIVAEYIETGQPVGSAHVARSTGMNVSSATVRNDMSTLEHEGYLRQPHTSAGRVPTDKGYRFFVDTIERPGPLDAVRTQQVRDFFAQAHGELEAMLRDTTNLLSTLTDYAAVVVGPPTEVATIRSIQVVGLSERISLLVTVLSNGVVLKDTVDHPEGVTADELSRATAHLSHHLIGHRPGHLGPIPLAGEPVVDSLIGRAVDELGGAAAHETDQPLFVGGTARMAGSFDAVESVRQVLSILEQQLVVVSLLRDVLDRGLSVAIGTETGVEPLAECSLVVAPYVVDGEAVGSVGVLGPTRMHYPQALATVAVVSKRLGRRLTEG